MTTSIELAPQQLEAKQLILDWYEALTDEENDSSIHPLFKLFGYAGTGKTTIIRQIIDELNIEACFAAFTGKAAMVMRKNGLPARS